MDQKLTSVSHLVDSVKDSFQEIFGKLHTSGFSLTGSLKQGGFSTNFFKAESGNRKIPTLDIDIVVSGWSYIDKKHRHCIKDFNKTGFVRVEVTPSEAYWRMFFTSFSLNLELMEGIINEMCYLKTYAVKELLILSKSLRSTHHRLWLSVILDIPLRKVDVKQSRKVTKSTSEQTNEIYLDGELKGILHMDMSILFRLDWSCRYNEIWQKRKRLWPDVQMLSEELNISYLIAKTSREEKRNKNATEFKYSFSHIENKIMSLLSQNQRTVFYTVKAIFKLYVKPHSEVYLPSFLVKNTLLWICEQTPPDHPLWKCKTEQDFLNTLRHFFVRLMRNFKDGFLPYYFIPEINLIEGIPEEISSNVLATLEQLTLDIKSHLPYKESRAIVKSWLDSMSNALYRTIDLIEAVKTFGPYVGILNSGKYAINNIIEYVNVEEGNHISLKNILSNKRTNC